MRQGAAKEKNDVAGKRRYDALNEADKMKKYKRDDENNAKRLRESLATKSAKALVVE